MYIKELLAKRLKKARQEKGYTQRDVGLLTGLSDKSISAYEKGKVVPPLEVLVKIAEVLEKPVSFFLEESIDTREVLLAELRSLREQLSRLQAEIDRLTKEIGSSS